MTYKRSKLIILIFTIQFALPLYSNNFEIDSIYFKANYDYPPYHYQDKDLNPTGFSIDILEAISKTMGLNVHLELDSWSQVRLDLENKKIDGIVGMSYSPQRSTKSNFSSPYIYITHSLFARKDSKIKSIEDIKDKQ
ncbi:MAG: histidine kinase, partial [Marinilabiliales bacterium]